MKSPNRTSPILALEAELKTLWGASAWPFTAAVQKPYASKTFSEAYAQLVQLLAVKASGVLAGPNGVGKSLLVSALLEQLPQKAYRPILLTHSSITAADLIRHLCKLQGIAASNRRGDNVLTLRETWQAIAPAWPVLIIEEAQNLSVTAMEEVRLLAADRADTQTPFSLLFVGDDNLMARLLLGVNRPLLSRFGFCIQMQAWAPEDLQAYIRSRLQEVAIHTDLLEPQAEQLLLQASGGLPRTLNHLAQRAMEHAARAHSRLIAAEHVRLALKQLPWLVKLPEQQEETNTP
ncbi:MAG: AAA family ATPase [Acidobacteriota bacterium]